MLNFRNFSFGSVSAVMTSLAMIIGLSNTPNAKASIVTALFIIAVADNISDSFGIHVHQESEATNAKEVQRITFTNFFARLLITAVFILFVTFLPMNLAIALSVLFGLAVIISISYFIAKKQKANPYKAIMQHLAIAALVMIASFSLRQLAADFVAKFF